MNNSSVNASAILKNDPVHSRFVLASAGMTFLLSRKSISLGTDGGAWPKLLISWLQMRINLETENMVNKLYEASGLMNVTVEKKQFKINTCNNVIHVYAVESFFS